MYAQQQAYAAQQQAQPPQRSRGSSIDDTLPFSGPLELFGFEGDELDGGGGAAPPPALLPSKKLPTASSTLPPAASTQKRAVFSSAEPVMAMKLAIAASASAIVSQGRAAT